MQEWRRGEYSGNSRGNKTQGETNSPAVSPWKAFCAGYFLPMRSGLVASSFLAFFNPFAFLAAMYVLPFLRWANALKRNANPLCACDRRGSGA